MDEEETGSLEAPCIPKINMLIWVKYKAQDDDGEELPPICKAAIKGIDENLLLLALVGDTADVLDDKDYEVDVFGEEERRLLSTLNEVGIFSYSTPFGLAPNFSQSAFQAKPSSYKILQIGKFYFCILCSEDYWSVTQNKTSKLPNHSCFRSAGLEKAQKKMPSTCTFAGGPLCLAQRPWVMDTCPA